MRLPLLPLLLCLTACWTAPPPTTIGVPSAVAPPRRPPHLPPDPVGRRLDLPQAELFVPENLVVAPSGHVPLTVHFQGGAPTGEALIAASGMPGVVIASTLSGRSSAFADAYRDPTAFTTLLSTAEREVGARSGRTITFAPITLTFFSAGYGAVRELLQQPVAARITALVSCDSIYADVLPGTRTPRPEQLAPFVAFAQQAAAGARTFVLAHSRIATDYAGTHECAAVLLAALQLPTTPTTRVTLGGVPIAAEAHRGGFHLYDFAERDAAIHVDLLHALPELLRAHVVPTVLENAAQ